jgi:hypothetical protein
VAEQFLPMFLANCKVWPAVNIISFTLVPLEHRMLFSQMINLVWGVYLSCEYLLLLTTCRLRMADEAALEDVEMLEED